MPAAARNAGVRHWLRRIFREPSFAGAIPCSGSGARAASAELATSIACAAAAHPGRPGRMPRAALSCPRGVLPRNGASCTARRSSVFMRPVGGVARRSVTASGNRLVQPTRDRVGGCCSLLALSPAVGPPICLFMDMFDLTIGSQWRFMSVQSPSGPGAVDAVLSLFVAFLFAAPASL